MSDKKNWMTEAGVNMSVTCMINKRIGQHKFLLAINHNHYNFWKKVHLGQTSPVRTMSKAKNLEISQVFFFFFFFRVSGCCFSYCDIFCDW